MSLKAFSWLRIGDTFYATNILRKREGPVMRKTGDLTAICQSNPTTAQAYKPESKILPTQNVLKARSAKT